MDNCIELKPEEILKKLETDTNKKLILQIS